MTWIDRRDRLPDAQTGKLVLAWHDQGGMRIETAFKVSKLSHYTHWAELPVAPGASAEITAEARGERTGDGERAQGAAAQSAAAQSAAVGSRPASLPSLYAAYKAAGFIPEQVAITAGITMYDYMNYENGGCERPYATR